MKSTSINNADCLDQVCCQCSCDHAMNSITHNHFTLPDTSLATGALLSMLLLIIYGLLGGVLVVVIAACVLIIGFGMGIIWKRYFPYQICSIKCAPQSTGKPGPTFKWSLVHDKKIFWDDPVIGCL